MGVAIAARSSWGARYDDGDLTLSGLAQQVFAHHSVTTQLPASATVEQERAEMRKIESIGESRFGTGISYNVLVFPSGRAYQGVSFNRRGTHTGGMNSTVRSICFAGNYDTARPTPAQLATAAAIYHEGQGKWWVSSAPLHGHRDVKSTACPGRYVYEQLAAIKAGPDEDRAILESGTKKTADVRTLQAFLNTVVVVDGRKLVVDGDYGDATVAAVKRYQRKVGLYPTGEVGERTHARLIESGIVW